MTVLTAQDIMNWFLYGQATTPSDLIDDSLIRQAGVTVTVPQDISAFMAGPGRFALGASFPLVTDFFQDSNLAPGVYTKQALGKMYGLGFYGLKFQGEINRPLDATRDSI